MTPIYYEAHVTTEPCLDEHWAATFEGAAAHYQFRPAKLLMVKGTRLERSDKDSFCTGHSSSYNELKSRMDRLVLGLREVGIKVWRAKIEAVIYDERFER